MVYVVSLQRQGFSFKVTIPKQWVKENLDAGSKIMFMVSGDVGVLELYSERSWYDRKFSKGSDEPNQAACEIVTKSDRQGLRGGARRKHENKGPAPADSITRRA